MFLAPTATGTDPSDPDTDGDGISDGDEVYGAPGGLDLLAMMGSPVHKDLFIECDWLTDDPGNLDKNRPHPNQVARLVAAFASAPVGNPDGTTGITLHFDYGQPPYGGGNHAGIDAILDTTVTLGGGFLAVKNAHFAANRLGYFYYMIGCDQYSLGGTPTMSSGIAELPGNDFIVALGRIWTGDDDRIGNTIMHELGHNLRLRHGGFENMNYKPNYNSILNYRFQFPGIDGNCDSVGDGVLDYSIGAGVSLDEDHLDETEGVCGSVGIDWNGGGLQTDVARNINCKLGVTTACGAFSDDCYDTTCDLLLDYDDWANIILDNLQVDDRRAPEIITCQEVPEKP